MPAPANRTKLGNPKGRVVSMGTAETLYSSKASGAEKDSCWSQCGGSGTFLLWLQFPPALADLAVTVCKQIQDVDAWGDRCTLCHI
ncbi:hypothetical protein MHYP_G00072870 [Metynnis hypsauchen]